MQVFVDTSALIAVLIAEDENHAAAGPIWRDLVAGDVTLVTSSYVVVEACALLQRRAGMSGVRTFLDDILPALSLEWVGEALHEAGVATLRTSGRSGANIVDCVSFATMRELRIRRAFAFDDHFATEGYAVIGGDGST